MLTLDIGPLDIQKLFFVFGRIGAIFLYFPLVGSNQIPARIKIMLALVISFFISPLISSQIIPESGSLIEIIILFSTEVVIGLIIAFAAHLIFSAFQIAGSIIDAQMGFGLANVLDPQDGPKNPVISKLYVILAILIYLAISAHHLTVFAIIESFQLINLQNFMISDSVMTSLLDLFASIFVSAIKISGPIMAVLFSVTLGMGLVGRVMPQMNVFIISFPLQIGIGLLMTALTLTIFNTFAMSHISKMPIWLSRFFQ
ncbi:MAG: flagellar biosynthetic protein FliR [Nitrospinales bacterium]